jgi:hypothetical protein
LAFVLGCLLSGATVKDVSLVPRNGKSAEEEKDGEADEDGEAKKKKKEAPPPVRGGFPRPKLPIIGHILMGLIPIAAAGICTYAASAALGHPVLPKIKHELARALPTTAEGLWEMPKQMVDLIRSTWEALGLLHWGGVEEGLRRGAFIYLAICLIVRIAPIRGNLRGAAGAMLLVGAAAIIVEMIRKGTTTPLLTKSWTLLTFTVGMLLLLLGFSLACLALVGVFRLIFARGAT